LLKVILIDLRGAAGAGWCAVDVDLAEDVPMVLIEKIGRICDSSVVDVPRPRDEEVERALSMTI